MYLCHYCRRLFTLAGEDSEPRRILLQMIQVLHESECAERLEMESRVKDIWEQMQNCPEERG